MRLSSLHPAAIRHRLMWHWLDSVPDHPPAEGLEREAAEQAGYAQLAASYEAEDAERRRIARRCNDKAAAYQDALWECYKLSGADTDGDEGPGALIAGNGFAEFARIVVESVRELRQDYDEALRSVPGQPHPPSGQQPE